MEKNEEGKKNIQKPLGKNLSAKTKTDTWEAFTPVHGHEEVLAGTVRYDP